jgi:Ca2+-transporting ATPase
MVALVMGAMALGLYAFFSARYGAVYGQTIAFCALVVFQWANAFNARSTFESVFSRLKVWNGSFYLGLTIAIALQALAIVGPLQSILHVHPIAFGDLFLVSALSFAIGIIVVEIHKFFGRRFIRVQAN